MKRPPLSRVTESVGRIAVYVAACLFAVPLAALGGVRHVLRWLGVKA